MQKILSLLTGKKTYSVMIGGLALAVSHVLSGDVSLVDGVKEALPYLGLGAVRAAIEKGIAVLKSLAAAGVFK